MTEKQLISRGKYLWKHYRWTNAMYQALFDLQKGLCSVCGKPPKEGGFPLVVDHIHFKITAMRRVDGGWAAISNLPLCPYFEGKTKKEAVEKCREWSLPRSVRGLLCPGRYGKAGSGCCNRLIGKIDNIPWLQNVIRYLTYPPAKKILTMPEENGNLQMEDK